MLPKPVALVALIGGSVTAVVLGGYLAARTPSNVAAGGRLAPVDVPEPRIAARLTPASPRGNAGSSASVAPSSASPADAGAAGGAGGSAAPGGGGGGGAAVGAGGAAAGGGTAGGAAGGGGAATAGASAGGGAVAGTPDLSFPPPLPRPRRAPQPNPYAYYPPPPGYGTPAAPAPAAPAAAPAPTPPPAAPAPPPRGPREMKEVLVPANTKIEVMLEKELSSETAKVEDAISAIVAHDVRLGADVAIPSGTRVKGTVVSVAKAGMVKGRAHVHLRFETLILPDEARVDIQTPTMAYEGASPMPGTVSKVGAASAGGALMGIVLGGRKAALTGLAAGAASGAAAAMKTPRPGAVIPPNESFDIRLLAPIKVVGAW